MDRGRLSFLTNESERTKQREDWCERGLLSANPSFTSNRMGLNRSSFDIYSLHQSPDNQNVLYPSNIWRNLTTPHSFAICTRSVPAPSMDQIPVGLDQGAETGIGGVGNKKVTSKRDHRYQRLAGEACISCR